MQSSPLEILSVNYSVNLDYHLSISDLYNRIPRISGDASRLYLYDDERMEPVQNYRLASCKLEKNMPLPLTLLLNDFYNLHIMPANLRVLLCFAYYFPNEISSPTFGLAASNRWENPQSDWDYSPPGERAYIERRASGSLFFGSLLSQSGYNVPSEVDERRNIHPALLSAKFLINVERISKDQLEDFVKTK
jgi:hypothetical protein